ncbi:DUF3850 domain-containing protein [Cronobacter sakazakii]|nr:DUF3850 domain-containing protein [Cronobacter sakazakii]
MSEIREPVTHNLKIWPEYYSAVCAGAKRAELRKNDRDYRIGDTIDLCEWDKDDESFTGEFISVTVTHVADVSEWMPGYVLLSIELALRKERERAEPVTAPDLHKVIYHFRDLNEGFPVERFKADYVISWMLANYPPAPPAPVVPDEITADFKLVSRKKCMKCDQTVFGYTVNGLCEECYMSEQATPVLPECLERLLRHAHGLTSGTDWNAGTAAKFHRDPLIQAVKDCRAIFTRQPLSVEMLAGSLRNAPLAPSDNQGSQCAPVDAGWIACSERMPKIGDEIFYYCEDDGIRDCGIVGSSNFTGRGDSELFVHSEGFDLHLGADITHWMPLPAAPTTN